MSVFFTTIFRMSSVGLILLCSLFLWGCTRYGISISQQRVDVNYLASTHVKTPDPRQENPPCGQILSIGWCLPRPLMKQQPQLVLHLIFWDYTEEVIAYPLDKRRGYITYRLLNEEFEEKKGLLTYKAEIVTEDGDVYSEWKHQLWVNLIHVEEDAPQIERAEL